ncbi:mechanosensitive ion channel family protein [Candidatus Bathyarchaeota archaeon]|nr:mechanosensitive ion channel family protein [Candidatus Bathyarchaeota archaeon]
MIDLSFLQGAPSVLYGVLFFILGLLVIKRIEKLLETGFKRRMPKGTAKSMARLTYYGLIFVVALVAMDIGGLRLDSLLVAGGIVGIALGFASQKTVSNLISGLFLYVDRPFDIGDSVEIGGTGGIIIDITPLSTRLRTWDGPIMRLPNEKVFGAEIKNFKKVEARRLEYKIGISYDSDVDNALKTIGDVLDREPYVLKEPSPDVYMSGLLDSAIEITVRAWVPTSKNFAVKTRILKSIYDSLKKAGVRIPNPQLDVHIKR